MRHLRSGNFGVTRQDEASNRRRPGRESSPIDPARILKVPARFVQLAEPQPHLSHKVKVHNNPAHDRSEEDREGRNDGEELRGAVDELPGLANPRRCDGGYSIPTYVDVTREDSGEIDSAY